MAFVLYAVPFFFLLIGRYLDHLMRRRTRDLAGNLAALKAETATRPVNRGSE